MVLGSLEMAGVFCISLSGFLCFSAKAYSQLATATKPNITSVLAAARTESQKIKGLEETSEDQLAQQPLPGQQHLK